MIEATSGREQLNTRTEKGDKEENMGNMGNMGKEPRLLKGSQ